MGASKTIQYSENTKSIAKIALALSHPARVQIINSLRENTILRSVDLQKILSLSKSTIHHHVIKLYNAQILQLDFYPTEYHLRLNRHNLECFENFLTVE